MRTVDEILAENEFFQGLAADAMKVIAGCASNVHYDAGQPIARAGETADRFYAVREGRASIEIHAPGHGPVVLQTVGSGEILGWSWLFPPYTWQFDAWARDPVRATAFDGACLRRKCEADAALGYELMKRFATIVSRRLEATRLQLLDVYGPASRR